MSRVQVFALGFVTALLLLIAVRNLGVTPGDSAVLIPAADLREDDSMPAAGMFLVARRALYDPFFAGSVVLLLEHGSHGTQGLIVNRRFHATLADAVPDLDGPEAERHRVFFGGPLGSHQIFMLLRNDEPLPRTQHIAANIYFSADREVLDNALTSGTPGTALRFYVGYASWGAGQLAHEIARGSWHLIAADPAVVFDAGSEQLWDRLIDQLEPEGIEVRHHPGPWRQLAALAD
jgi:putative transcriptional regulator